jgi:hypothetical protein
MPRKTLLSLAEAATFVSDVFRCFSQFQLINLQQLTTLERSHLLEFQRTAVGGFFLVLRTLTIVHAIPAQIRA